MARRRSHSRRRSLGASPLIRAAKACKGKPGFKKCVMSHMNGLGGRRRRSR